MTPRLKISSALMATLIALSSLSGPAFAGGITMVLTPHGDAANLLQTGLQIYSMVEQQKGKKKKNHAKVDQKGSDNAAAPQPNRGRQLRPHRPARQGPYRNRVTERLQQRTWRLPIRQKCPSRLRPERKRQGEPRAARGLVARQTMAAPLRSGVYSGEFRSCCRPTRRRHARHLHQLPARRHARRCRPALRSSHTQIFPRLALHRCRRHQARARFCQAARFASLAMRCIARNHRPSLADRRRQQGQSAARRHARLCAHRDRLGAEARHSGDPRADRWRRDAGGKRSP